VETGISSGPISGFGSIVVAGTRWETDSAESITIDGMEVSENDLRLGMQVTVEGTRSNDGGQGRASRIAVNNRARGPVSLLPAPEVISASESGPEEVVFSVLGVNFIAGRTTAFSAGGNLWSLLEVGAWVEVSGVPGLDDRVRATRVDFKSPPPMSEPRRVAVEGVVSNPLDTSFSLGAGELQVLLSAHLDCTDPTAFPDGDISHGTAVEVHGEWVGEGRVCATKVEILQAFADAGDFEIVGIVSSVEPDGDRFTLGGLQVETDRRTTTFEPRRLVIGEGRMLTVKGSLEDGMLSALEVEQEAGLMVEAPVESLVNGGPDFVVLGLVIEVFSEGGTQIAGGPYGVGSSVEVQALRKATGGFTAVEVEVEEDPASRVRLEGRVDAVNEFYDGFGSLRVEGVLVSVDPDTECEEASGKIIDCGKLFDTLELGDIVKATGSRHHPDFEEAAMRLAFGR